MELAFYSVVGCAIAVMLGALVQVFRLRQIARGGSVGRVVNVLAGFISFFTIGYLVSPFFLLLPASVVHLTAAIIFLFGAVFVVLVMRLIESLVRKVFEELDL